MDALIANTRYISLSGGGMRGIAFVGALAALERYAAVRQPDLFVKLKGVGGASIGALIALLLVLGFRSGDLRRLLFHDHLLRQVFAKLTPVNLYDGLALDDGLALREWMASVLRERTGLPETCTFADLRRATGRSFAVSITEIRGGRGFTWSDRLTPNREVVGGVYAAMALPPIFEPLREGDLLYADGALLCYYLASAFPPNETLGFILRAGRAGDLRNSAAYVERVLNVAFAAHERLNLNRELDAAQQARIAWLSADGMSSLQFNAPPEVLERVYREGERSMEAYLQQSPLMLALRLSSVGCRTSPLYLVVRCPNHEVRDRVRDSMREAGCEVSEQGAMRLRLENPLLSRNGLEGQSEYLLESLHKEWNAISMAAVPAAWVSLESLPP